MIAVDLKDEVRAALTSDEVLRALGQALRPLVAEALADELRRREEDAYLDSAGAARLLSISPAAFKMRRRRDPVLDELSVGSGHFRRWRRSDLERYLRELHDGAGGRS